MKNNEQESKSKDMQYMLNDEQDFFSKLENQDLYSNS